MQGFGDRDPKVVAKDMAKDTRQAAVRGGRQVKRELRGWRRWPKWVWGIAAVVLLVVIYALFFRSSGGEGAGGQAAAGGMMGMGGPASVVVQRVQAADVPLTFEYAGRTAGSRVAEIRPRVTGIVLARTYREGQPVQAGDILFRIDPAPFRAQLAQVQAQLTQASKDFERVQSLFAEQAISPREFDAAKSSYDQARAAVDAARINLGYTIVRSPISGIASKEQVTEGALVTADTTLLTQVTQLQPLYVDFAIPDDELARRRAEMAAGELKQVGAAGDAAGAEGLVAEIRFANGVPTTYEGRVNFTDSIVDTQTGAVSGRAVVPNSDGSLLPGQFVRVVLKGLVRHDAVLVPDQAVMQGPKGPFVYTAVVSSTYSPPAQAGGYPGAQAHGGAAPQGQSGPQTLATVVPVTLGELTPQGRIVGSGLKSGDVVIVEGMIKTRPGAPLKISETVPSAAGQAAAGMPVPQTQQMVREVSDSVSTVSETTPQ